MENEITVQNLTFDQLLTKNSIKFFSCLNLSSDFLLSDPITWNDREDFQTTYRIIKTLQVINDSTERCISLINQYNLLLTRDNEIQQNIVKIVKKYRECFPDCNRDTLKRKLLDFYVFNKKDN